MRLGKKKYLSYSFSYSRSGRKKGYVCNICYNDKSKTYYFTAAKNKKTYNSLWDDKSYSTEDTCAAACEEYVDAEEKK